MPRAFDARAQRQCTAGKSAEKSGHDGEHGGGFVAQPQSALLRPDDLIAQPGKTGRDHEAAREEMA